jgi:hypothetical protein
MKRLARVSEAEVISEFLNAEFYRPEFDPDRAQFEAVVRRPNLEHPQENAVRRALLFRRRGHMWRELPADTEWWAVELEAGDLDRIRVFPRAQWRAISKQGYELGHIVERVRTARFEGSLARVVHRIQTLSQKLQRLEQPHSAVLLIGINESKPLTILEGNHRLTAALMVSPELARSRFRVLAGFSPRMTESCWYVTNLPNLWRYAKNRLRNLRDREADVNRVLTPETLPAMRASSATAEPKRVL